MKTQGNKKHCINHSKHDIMIDFYAQKDKHITQQKHNPFSITVFERMIPSNCENLKNLHFQEIRKLSSPNIFSKLNHI